MANSGITQLLSLINQEVDSREALKEHLSKAESLAHIALNDDFLTYPRRILYFYLWVLSDIIEHAKILNEQSLDTLLAQKV
jgi:hypothetical protein